MSLHERLSPERLTDLLEQALADNHVSDFQRPYVLQRMQERLRGLPHAMTGIPVGIEEFINSSDYLNKPGTIYPKVMEALVEANRDGVYDEAVLTGGIGSGKTTIALYTTAYQLYRLSLYRKPHEHFGLDPTSEIVFIFQSMNYAAAKQVDYNRFKELVQQAPYFTENFQFNRKIESKLVFRNRIEVQPVSGMETAAIGQNVIGGIIDELNYMAVVDRSKATPGGQEGVYDQAIALYNSISRRRKSRFLGSQGGLPGLLCLVSSKRYPGQFTDIKEEEAKTDPRIFVYDKRTWDVKPEGTYSGETFTLFIGDEFRKPFIREDLKPVPDEDRDLYIDVPEEHRADFERDTLNALREVAGISTLSLHPFLVQTDDVIRNFRKDQKQVLSRTSCDFRDTKLNILVPRFIEPHQPRWIHVDLGVTSDSAGVVCGFVKGFRSIKRGADVPETLPEIHIDFALEVPPPRNGEIAFYKVRSLIYKLSEQGINVKWVSYDSYQSTDSMQILRRNGYSTGIISMDTNTVPYDFLKTALYDHRLYIPVQDKLRHELTTLERDQQKGKIDHPPKGSKDIADALAGVVYGLTMRREIWHRFGIPQREIPESVREAAQKSVKVRDPVHDAEIAA